MPFKIWPNFLGQILGLFGRAWSNRRRYPAKRPLARHFRASREAALRTAWYKFILKFRCAKFSCYRAGFGASRRSGSPACRASRDRTNYLGASRSGRTRFTRPRRFSSIASRRGHNNLQIAPRIFALHAKPCYRTVILGGFAASRAYARPGTIIIRVLRTRV